MIQFRYIAECNRNSSSCISDNDIIALMRILTKSELVWIEMDCWVLSEPTVRYYEKKKDTRKRVSQLLGLVISI